MKSAALLESDAYNYFKKLKYALLEFTVELISRLRSHSLRILPVATSTHGEFCTGAVELQDWLNDTTRTLLFTFDCDFNASITPCP
jgi:hypothetical protein